MHGCGILSDTYETLESHAGLVLRRKLVCHLEVV